MKMLPEKSVTSYCVQFENEPDKLNDYWDKKFSHTDKIDFAVFRLKKLINGERKK